MSSSGGGGSARKLGRYHLVEPIGGGPTGEVFRAKVYGVAGFERQFAVKRFHAELVKAPETTSALASAARQYGNLEHPRIARMQEFGVAGGETFAAIEMVEGIDVAKLVQATFGQGQPLVMGAGLTLIKQAARAVGYAHGRGICHHGICPTNILCQPEGDVKVTDFGFLPPRLPARPADDLTLLARMPYLAPEQLIGEETSAATDVFQLGVVLYEVLTGEKPFSGRMTLDVAQAILSGAPAPLSAPKPVVQLMFRALARSPLERFPDAGALADGIEAALRATPLPGGTRDIANIVRSAADRLEQLSSEQMSGAFAFPMPAPPSSAMPAAGPAMPPPGPAMPPPTPLPSPAAVAAGESPLARALKKGTAPPPIPPAPGSGMRRTVMGVAPIPAPGSERVAFNHVDEDAPTRVREDMASGDIRPSASQSDVTPLPVPLPADPSLDLDFSPRESQVRRASELADSLAPGAYRDGPGPPTAGAEPMQIVEIEADAPPMMPPPFEQPATAPKRGTSRVLLVVAAAALMGAGGFFGYRQLFPEEDAATQPKRPGTASKVEPPKAAGIDAGTAVAAAPVGDAGAVAVAAKPSDAAPAVVAAAPPDAAPKRPPAAEGKLVIESKPDGAVVYLGGTEVGETPITIDATPDSHVLALVKPGYKLHVAQVEGSGHIDVALTAVTPINGRAGIKVRCKKKNRYYVILDGEDTGQLCPTERLGVSLGEHVVEIYDPVTDTRNSFPANVKETRRSLRVRVD
jgi:serine/threonine-protein kinase